MPTSLYLLLGVDDPALSQLTPAQRMTALGAFLNHCRGKLREMPHAKPISDLVKFDAEDQVEELPGSLTLQTRIFDFHRVHLDDEGEEDLVQVVCLNTEGGWWLWEHRPGVTPRARRHRFRPLSSLSLEPLLADDTLVFVIVSKLLRAVREGEKRTRKSHRGFVIADYELTEIMEQLGYTTQGI
jgi:hypothetical protein